MQISWFTLASYSSLHVVAIVTGIMWVKGVWFPWLQSGIGEQICVVWLPGCIAGEELSLMWPKDKANGLAVYGQGVRVCVCVCVNCCILTPNSINPVHLRESVLIDFSLFLLTQSCVRCVCVRSIAAEWFPIPIIRSALPISVLTLEGGFINRNIYMSTTQMCKISMSTWGQFNKAQH